MTLGGTMYNEMLHQGERYECVKKKCEITRTGGHWTKDCTKEAKCFNFEALRDSEKFLDLVVVMVAAAKNEGCHEAKISVANNAFDDDKFPVLNTISELAKEGTLDALKALLTPTGGGTWGVCMAMRSITRLALAESDDMRRENRVRYEFCVTQSCFPFLNSPFPGAASEEEALGYDVFEAT
ncbi:hypothetical protein L1987_22298 [Smallanthus sonchifolius]|uniref:Uncharacterized protein n=1 Tax=Smallanthus sonchifolius TaxID=185202 RepID=A0ACB9IDR1_9ASTR|nr:hypothetical protein L1987_22298 [Smallanthus sonchifolius]